MLCSILQFDHRQDMSGLTTPTLIIQPSNDNAVPPGVAGYLHKTIAGSWLVLIDAEGHLPHISAPERLVAAITPFLYE